MVFWRKYYMILAHPFCIVQSRYEISAQQNWNLMLRFFYYESDWL